MGFILGFEKNENFKLQTQQLASKGQKLHSHVHHGGKPQDFESVKLWT